MKARIWSCVLLLSAFTIAGCPPHTPGPNGGIEGDACDNDAPCDESINLKCYKGFCRKLCTVDPECPSTQKCVDKVCIDKSEDKELVADYNCTSPGIYETANGV